MALMDEQKLKEFYEKLESKGEEKVRQELKMGIYGYETDPKSKAPLVKDWLDRKEQAREEEKRNKEIDLSQEVNEIAKEANHIAKNARNASWSVNSPQIFLDNTIEVWHD